jgi:hypothetical protein
MPNRTPGPSPAGWYEDPYEHGVLRYHDGTRWTEQTRAFDGGGSAGTAEVPPTEPLPGSAPTPRPAWLRLLLAAGGLALVWAAVNVLGHTGRTGLILSAGLLLAIVPGTATRVSYRSVDVVFMLIPFYNLYFQCRIAWRLAYLPYRDWEPRFSEADDWVPVRHPRHADTPLYLTRQQLARFGSPAVMDNHT